MRHKAIVAALIGVGLLLLILPDLAERMLLFDAAGRTASERVDAALARTQQSFLTLSGTKAGVAVVEGSAVGVGFALQVGDLVQPIYDLVHFFWRIFLFSFFILGAYKLAIESGVLGLGLPILGAALLLIAAGRLATRHQTFCYAAARRLALLGVLIAYLIPLSLLLTHWLSDTYTKELRQRYRADITAFGETLDAARDAVLEPESQAPWYDPGAHIEDFQGRVMAAARHVADAFDASVLSFAFYSLLVSFDALIFPFTSAFLIYRLAGFTVVRLLPG